jgi:hypothetical protein
MNETLIHLTGLDAATITASEEARRQRDNLLYQSKSITVVRTTEEAEAAGKTLTAIKEFTRLIEDTRTQVGAPVLALTRKINDMAKELTLAADFEAVRISRLVGSYNTEQARLAEKKRQDALAEERRIAEETRKKLAAAEDAGASEKKLDKIEAKAFEQLAVAKADTAAAVAPKMAGISTRKEICFEVTDIAALYKSFPALVKMEPNNQAIKAILKNSPGGLPGVRHWAEDRAVVR